MKLRAALMICTALIAPTAADAAPVTAFIAGLSGLAGGAAAFTGLSAIAYSVGAFFTTTVGSLLLNLGINALLAGKSNAPPVDKARVNTRLNDAPRWQLAGLTAVGGEIGIFAEHDEESNFWFIVAHGDAELCGEPKYFLDGIEVELSDGTDGFTAGDVITDAFCLNSAGDQYEGTGTKVPNFRLYPVTPTAGNVFGALPSDFTTALPIPNDFKLAGVCFTVVRCRWPTDRHYSKAYRWGGGFRLGEPSVMVVGNFNRMYDPRNAAHDINDVSTWTASDGNPAIIWAWFRTAPYGRARPMSEINWAKVATAANACDQTVIDRSANPIPRYRCGVAFPDNKPRHECEAEILLTMDAFVAYDDDGKAYPVAGVYEAPTLTFTAARDIMSAQTQIIDDGESAIDGVIVNYISPVHGYTKQSAAPWINDLYYDGTSEPNFETLDVLGCQDHNQAVRIAKSIGLRSAALKKAGLQTGLKGILASGVRTISLDYDVNFNGDYEIVSPVEEDPNGMSCTFAVVPMQTNRFDLEPGEEGEPPQPTPALDIDRTLAVATSVVVTANSVVTSSGDAVRLQATFDEPSRPDRSYRFRYTKTGEEIYQYFAVDMDFLLGYTAIVDDGQSYVVSWQTVTGAGRATEWNAGVTIVATADPTPPAALVSFAAADGVGSSVVSFSTGNSANQSSVRIYRDVVATFGTGAIIANVVAGANVSGTVTDTGLAAGTYYYWGVPVNGSGVNGTASGPDTAVIT
jgi:hypothetical protein